MRRCIKRPGTVYVRRIDTGFRAGRRVQRTWDRGFVEVICSCIFRLWWSRIGHLVACIVLLKGILASHGPMRECHRQGGGAGQTGYWSKVHEDRHAKNSPAPTFVLSANGAQLSEIQCIRDCVMLFGEEIGVKRAGRGRSWEEFSA